MKIWVEWSEFEGRECVVRNLSNNPVCYKMRTWMEDVVFQFGGGT